MVARTGLFVKPLPGSPPQGTSPTDGRLVFGALFGTTGGCISGGTLTASATLMQVSVAAAVWRIPDPTNTGAIHLAPADPDTFTFSAGPASGSRIDVLWVRQNNYEAGDANSRVTYGVAQGTAASSPVAPAIPGGALKIGQLTVPAGVSNAAACVLVASYAGAGVLRPQITVTTEQQLPAVGDFVGQLAYVAQVSLGSTTAPVVERWSGSAWRRWDSSWFNFDPQVNGFNGGRGSTPGYGVDLSRFRYVAGRIQQEGRIYLQGTTVVVNAGDSLFLYAATAMETILGKLVDATIWATDDSDGRRRYRLDAYIENASQYRLLAPTSTAGAYGLTGPTVPFQWAQNDLLEWSIKFDPA